VVCASKRLFSECVPAQHGFTLLLPVFPIRELLVVMAGRGGPGNSKWPTRTVIGSNPTVMGLYGPDKEGTESRKAHRDPLLLDYCQLLCEEATYCCYRADEARH
jgi:hypothetical protein